MRDRALVTAGSNKAVSNLTALKQSVKPRLFPLAIKVMPPTFAVIW